MRYVGKISKLEMKPGQRGNYVVLGVDSISMTEFTPAKLEGLKVGDLVEVEFSETTRNGKTYKNLVNIFKRTDEMAAQTHDQPPVPGPTLTPKDKIILAEVCLDKSTTLHSHTVEGKTVAEIKAMSEELSESIVDLSALVYGKMLNRMGIGD